MCSINFLLLTVICGNVWSSWRNSSNSLGITRGSGWRRSIRGWHVVTFTHFFCKLFSGTPQTQKKNVTHQKRRTPVFFTNSPTPIGPQRKNKTASIYNRGNVVTKLMNRRAFGGRSALVSRSKSGRPRSNFSSEPTVKTKTLCVQCLNGRGQDAIKHCPSYIILSQRPLIKLEKIQSQQVLSRESAVVTRSNGTCSPHNFTNMCLCS